MPEILINGKRLSYVARPEPFDPSSLAVVFVHGTGGDAYEWQAQWEALSDVCTMVAVELPGHGRSEGPVESSVPACAQWVSDLVETLGLTKVIPVGFSLGGAIALWLALAQKPWVKALGLVGSGGRLRVHPALLEGVFQYKDKSLSMLADYSLGSDPDPALRTMVMEKYAKNPPELIHADLKACNEFDVMDRLSRISLPTLIAVGEQDKLTPPKYAQFLNKAISGSLLAVIPSAGHLVMAEQPARFNAMLRGFVEKQERIAG